MSLYKKIVRDGTLTGYARQVNATDTITLPPDHPDIVSWLAGGGVADPPDIPPLTFSRDQTLGGKVRTTDVTPMELYRLPLALQTGYAIGAVVIGVDGGSGAVRVVRASVALKRLNAAAVQVGATVVIANHADAAAGTWVINPSVSGNDFVVVVTGAAGRTIDWSIAGVLVSFTPAGT